jgi:hypothetical protein
MSDKRRKRIYLLQIHNARRSKERVTALLMQQLQNIDKTEWKYREYSLFSLPTPTSALAFSACGENDSAGISPPTDP